MSPRPAAPIPVELRAFASPHELQVLEVLDAAGWPHFSIELAVSAGYSTIAGLHTVVRRIRQRAARAGIAPESDQTVPIPPGYHARGHSTLYAIDEAGNRVPKIQWVKTQVDREDQAAAMRAAAEEMSSGHRGLLDPIDAPAESEDDTLCVYPVGDHHLGMLAWREETGESYDLGIAERTLNRAVDELVTLAPPSRHALVALMGDFFHADSRRATTEASGNLLDVDGRYARVIQAAVRIMRRTIDRVLQHHAEVRVIVIGGNHDYHSSLWLAIALDALYDREPRVLVDTSPAERRYHEFGANLLGFAHGHSARLPALPSIMAAERSVEWGRTSSRRWYTGHRHQQIVHSFPGCIVEVLEVLPPADAWHAAQGYVHAGRSMRVDVWDRVDGLVCSRPVGIRRIHRALAEGVA